MHTKYTQYKGTSVKGIHCISIPVFILFVVRYTAVLAVHVLCKILQLICQYLRLFHCICIEQLQYFTNSLEIHIFVFSQKYFKCTIFYMSCWCFAIVKLFFVFFKYVSFILHIRIRKWYNSLPEKYMYMLILLSRRRFLRK